MVSRLKDFLARPVQWGAVLLSYAGIIAAVAYAASSAADNSDAVRHEADRSTQRIELVIDRIEAESQQRTHDFCRVIINSHEATVSDVDRLRRSVQGARLFIHLPGADPDLRKLAQQQLPRTLAALKTAKEREVAIRPPATCRRRQP